MRNLDSCRCWRCTLCPCKVRNKFLVNFWNRTILLCIPCIYMKALWHWATSHYVLLFEFPETFLWRRGMREPHFANTLSGLIRVCTRMSPAKPHQGICPCSEQLALIYCSLALCRFSTLCSSNINHKIGGIISILSHKSLIQFRVFLCRQGMVIGTRH
jgi:hypothetical protein